jgi:hypothetical protein
MEKKVAKLPLVVAMTRKHMKQGLPPIATITKTKKKGCYRNNNKKEKRWGSEAPPRCCCDQKTQKRGGSFSPMDSCYDQKRCKKREELCSPQLLQPKEIGK